jgi:hypothetical protein
MMLYSAYNLVVCGILLLTINAVAVVTASTMQIVTTSISCFAVSFSFLISFIPKMYLHHMKPSISAAAVFGAAIRKV